MRLRLALPVLLTALAAAPSAQEAARAPQRPQQERAAAKAPRVQPPRSAPAVEPGAPAQAPRQRGNPNKGVQDPTLPPPTIDALDARIAAMKARAARAEASGKPIAPERIARHMEVLRRLQAERDALAPHERTQEKPLERPQERR